MEEGSDEFDVRLHHFPAIAPAAAAGDEYTAGDQTDLAARAMLNLTGPYSSSPLDAMLASHHNGSLLRAVDDWNGTIASPATGVDRSGLDISAECA
jgi:hypothetical protein